MTSRAAVSAGAMFLLLVAMPSGALAAKGHGNKTTEPASKYDAGGQLHNDVCATPKYAQLDPTNGLYLRSLDGSWTGFSLLRPAFTDPPACASGQVRLD